MRIRLKQGSLYFLTIIKYNTIWDWKKLPMLLAKAFVLMSSLSFNKFFPNRLKLSNCFISHICLIILIMQLFSKSNQLYSGGCLAANVFS